MCNELLLIRLAHQKYLAPTTSNNNVPQCLLDYEERRAADDDFMATVSDFRVSCAIKYGQVLAAMHKIQEREAVRALVELRGTPYSDPTRQSERNKIET